MPRFDQLVLMISGALALLSAAVPAAASSTPAMPIGGVTSQPIGHFEFCQTHREECIVRSDDTAPARLTEFGWATVQRVNVAVNTSVDPVTDQELYGRDEVWAYPDAGAGDCEDFVLEKRRQLMKAGFPTSDLLITVVRKPKWRRPCRLDAANQQG